MSDKSRDDWPEAIADDDASRNTETADFIERVLVTSRNSRPK
jgi:hypothetical protein